MAYEDSVQTERDLIRKRATIKSKLTTFTKFVGSCEETENIHIEQLKLRIERLEKEFETFDSVQQALELLASDNDYEIRLNERTEFEDQYYEALAIATRIVKDNDKAHGQVDQPSQTAATREQGQTVHQFTQPSGSNEAILNNQSPLTITSDLHVKLPTMHLPKFGGAYEAWPGFADAFKSAVHDNPTFRDAQKLIYLKSCLTGKAAEKVESLETTAANYSVAWNILERYYNDPSIVINNRVQAFFELPACSRGDVRTIGELTDTATKHYNALKALNKPFLEAFPIYAVTNKLDEQTRLRWKERIQGIDLPSMEDLLDFLHNRRKVLETTKLEPPRPLTRPNHAHANYKLRNRGSINRNVQSLAHPAQQVRCFMCKGSHFTLHCQRLTNANIDQRIEMVRNAGLCNNCLRPNHDIKDCTAGSCKQCNGKHHTLLHKEQQPVRANVSALNVKTENETLLSTAIVYIRDNRGNLQSCRALLDSGAQSHFITERFAKLLSLPQQDTNIPVIGINHSSSRIKNTVRATVKSRINNFTFDLTFFILPHITEILPSRPISKAQLNIPSNIPLADPGFNIPSEIDALIGVELFFKLLCVGQIAIADGAITLQKTKIGWILAGKLPDERPLKATRCHVTRESLEARVAKFWELEETPHGIALSPEERACEFHFKTTTTRDPTTGQYITRLPFKTLPPSFGDSYSTARRRFVALERNFIKDPNLRSQYIKFLSEYRDLGHMTKLENPNTQDGYYLPHHAIIKHDSLTTKLRVVFDASAKSSNGVSLNDTLLIGPTIQEELYALLIRFRSYTYVLTADIAKMYRQILIDPRDRIYQKILWRETSDQPIETYILNTVTYGTSAAPFLATRTLQQLAADEGEKYPRAARVLREDFYVDDMLTGANTYKEAAATLIEIRSLCARAGFQLRQWATNEESLIAALHDKTNATHLRLDLDQTIKTLGIHWNARRDTLAYSVRESTPLNRVTKRTILSKIATLFDPLGLLGPIIIRAKLIMQSLWKIQLNWDESVPADIHTEWCTYWQDLTLLRDFSVNRHILQSNHVSVQLHGFCDASERAYGACLYVRSINRHGNIITRLVSSKSRVAPLKTITLPRLELCAAHLLAKLYAMTKRALRNIEFNKILFWSDSTIALHWIKSSPHTLKTFVSHRVADIQTLTGQHEWRHIISASNPADLISRGMHTQDCIRSDLWHYGPSWLALQEESWPVSQLQSIEIPDLRPIIALPAQTKVEFLERFSSFQHLRRVVAYILRFARNCLKREPSHGPLTTFELHKAEVRIIILAQQQSYRRELHELKSTGRIEILSSLTPFLDPDGILRVGGRLSHSELPYNEKHPILLHKTNYVTKLIVRDEHIKNLHAGAQMTLNAVRRAYWIPQGRGLVRKTIHECIICRRAKPTAVNYLMGDLPTSRVTQSRPFLQCGVDFCGPIFIKEKMRRNRGKIKVYLAIFVCFATRAVHIEVVSDLTTDAFLAALRRFFSRRVRTSRGEYKRSVKRIAPLPVEL
ncbi:hypothetical protein ANTQUA_LOCUS8181, partial [Anthophora quadrimaculata]